MKLTVSCFGKLRILADFVEPAHASGFDTRLREWMAGAVDLDDLSVGHRRAYRLAWPLHGGKDLCVASLWSSVDSVRRGFPFALYTQVSVERLEVGSCWELVLSLVPIWEALEEIAIAPNGHRWTDLVQGEASALDILKSVRRSRIRYRPDNESVAAFETSLQASTAVEFLNELLSQSFWVLYPRTAWKLAGLARRLRENDVDNAVRLPATARLPLPMQATFWLRTLESLTSPAVPRMPCLILPLKYAEESGIWILFREPTQRDLAVLFGSPGVHPDLSDLRRVESPGRTELERDDFETFSRAVQERLGSSGSGLELTRLPLLEIREQAGRPVTIPRGG